LVISNSEWLAGSKIMRRIMYAKRYSGVCGDGV
jgi:hypothetical protein